MLSKPSGSSVYFGEIWVHPVLEAAVVSSVGAADKLLDSSRIPFILTGETPLPTLY